MYPRIIHYCLPGVIVGLQQTSYTVGEGNGSLSVCTFLNGDTQREVIVSLSTEQGSAQGITSSLNIQYAACVLQIITFVRYPVP